MPFFIDLPLSGEELSEEIAANMLEDLEKITGISIGEMMAEEIEEPPDVTPDEFKRAGEEGTFEVFPLFEEPTDDRPLDLDNPDGEDTDEYFDELFDNIDVDADVETDQYSED